MQTEIVTNNKKAGVNPFSGSMVNVEIKPNRTAKSGKALKAVFGRWDGEALVTEAGRLASRKDFGSVTETKGVKLTTDYAKAQASFNTLGEATLAKEQSEVASGRREMKRIYTNPKNGRTILETAPADKAVKVVEALKGLPQDVQDKVLAALKMA